MYNLFKVDKCRGYENPNVYVESPVDIHRTMNGWLVEDVIKGDEWEFTDREEAESFAATVESWYMEDWSDFFHQGEY